jgi:drug/metabolite transporter (DMT)-like permease
MFKEASMRDRLGSNALPQQPGRRPKSRPSGLKPSPDASALPPGSRTTSKAEQWIGCLLVFCAAALFYFSTATIRWAAQHVTLDPAFFVFVRFVTGFVLVNLVVLVKRQSLQAKRYDLLVGRAVANTVAVYCFYTAVSKTTLAEANILNMTYPVFVALFSWIFLKHQRDSVMTIGALVAFAGIWLVLARGPLSLGWHHLWGLTSGICAAWAIIFLNLSRRHHDTQTVLFYLFGLGAILTYAAFPSAIFWPSRSEAYYLALCSGFAIAGQYCITFGYRYVTAVEGGIISSSRILLAAILGPFIAADPVLLLKGWFGAAIIMGVNILLAVRKAGNAKPGKGS